MPRTKEPPEVVALSEVPFREKHELGVGHEDDHGNDTLVNRGVRQVDDVTVERRKKGDDDSDSDSGSPTGSSDEFDWDEEDDAASVHNDHHVVKAKRGRAAYLGFMKLARPLRVALLCILGGGILIAPLLVVHFVFGSNAAKKHVFAWSIWLTIIWVASCLTYVVVDAFGWVFLGLVSLFGGKTESLQMQLEVRPYLPPFPLLHFCYLYDAYQFMITATVGDCSFCVGQTCFGYLLGLDFPYDYPEHLQASWFILGLR